MEVDEYLKSHPSYEYLREHLGASGGVGNQIGDESLDGSVSTFSLSPNDMSSVDKIGDKDSFFP